jgi:ribonuclease III
MEKDRTLKLKLLQKNIYYKFKNISLLNQALTHKSYINENPDQGYLDNERFEFLGDAVLDVIISHLLMEALPNHTEGDLTKLRASIVNEKMFADLARKLNLGDFLLLGKGEDSTEGRNKNSILADTYEALIASIYLDRGFKSVFKVAIKHFTEILSAAVQGNLSHEDFKSKLQEYAQSVLRSTPQYISVNESGPDHNKSFEVNVTLNKKLLGTGFGKSKKDAAQNAAKEALEKLSKVSEDD